MVVDIDIVRYLMVYMVYMVYMYGWVGSNCIAKGVVSILDIVAIGNFSVGVLIPRFRDIE